MREPFFHYSPLARDVLDIMWAKLRMAARHGDEAAWSNGRVALEQYACMLRNLGPRGEYHGSETTVG
jgi:hypothetical protein